MRPGGFNPAAAHANLRDPGAERERIYSWFVARGPEGDTREACLIALGLADHGGYPRCTDLVRDGRLVVKWSRGKKVHCRTVKGNSAGILVADARIEAEAFAKRNGWYSLPAETRKAVTAGRMKCPICGTGLR